MTEEEWDITESPDAHRLWMSWYASRGRRGVHETMENDSMETNESDLTRWFREEVACLIVIDVGFLTPFEKSLKHSRILVASILLSKATEPEEWNSSFPVKIFKSWRPTYRSDVT